MGKEEEIVGEEGRDIEREEQAWSQSKSTTHVP